MEIDYKPTTVESRYHSAIKGFGMQYQIPTTPTTAN